MPKSKIKNEDFYLNKGLLNEFRNTINSTNIFQKTPQRKEKYNLICVVMDRLDSAIGYLNKHEKQPERLSPSTARPKRKCEKRKRPTMSTWPKG